MFNPHVILAQSAKTEMSEQQKKATAVGTILEFHAAMKAAVDEIEKGLNLKKRLLQKSSKPLVDGKNYTAFSKKFMTSLTNKKGV